MHDFQYHGKELFCEDVLIKDVAKAIGTPFYLYSTKTITDHYRKLEAAFSEINPLICFAMKANSNLAVIKLLSNLGAGLDIVSGGELQKALKVKADPKKIVFASVGKTDDEIRLALKCGILLFNVESVPEMERINTLAKELNIMANVAIRLNPDVEAATHDFITTGTLKKKFGIDIHSTHALFKKRQKYHNLKISGLHIHIGSQITSAGPFVKAIKRVVAFIEELQSEGVELEYLDIGGGLGIIYKDEKPQTAQSFAKEVLPLLKKIGLKIILEPGRFIVGNAGIFVTKVLYLKDNGIKKFLIVDGGMNDLIRPSLYQAYHAIEPVTKSQKSKINVDIVGPICESGDFLGKDRVLPALGPGDLLAVMGAGAYGFVMSSNYNVRCRVPEIIVKGNNFAITRKRETLTDLLRLESIPNFLK